MGGKGRERKKGKEDFRAFQQFQICHHTTDSEELFIIETSCNTNSWPAGVHAM